MDSGTDSQDLLPETTTSPELNLYTERRVKVTIHGTTDTSKSSTLSKLIEKRKKETDEDSDSWGSPDTETDEDVVVEEPVQSRKSKRQMLLGVTGGQLRTKKPLVNPIKRSDPRRVLMARVATETATLLPGLLATRPDVSCQSFLCQKQTVDAKYNPRLPSTKVHVVNMDTIDAALNLHANRPPSYKGEPAAILNMANAIHPGGGWRHGALAQEEALCYRSSLSQTLHREHYPIPDDAVLYSPTVMIIRDNMSSGHNLLDFRDPRQLQIISVISCAAVCHPSLNTDKNGNRTYARPVERNLMLEKMRIILRTAIRNRNRQIVLGALGCGVFGNPNTRVAEMWKTVLQEPEFGGGWWEDVVFAVLGNNKPGDNFQVFHSMLEGLVLT